MNRLLTTFKFSLDSSLQSFLKKYKTTAKPDPQPAMKPLKNADKGDVKSAIKPQEDSLKMKFLKNARLVPLEEKDFFSHHNRAQQLLIDEQDREQRRLRENELRVLREQAQGEQLYDQADLPPHVLANANKQRELGIQKLEKIDNIIKGRHIYDASDYEEYESLAEWKQFHEFKAPLEEKLKKEKLKDYPGTKKGSEPWQDPEGFTEWFVANHSAELVNSYQDVLEILDPEPIQEKDEDEEQEQEESEEDDDDGTYSQCQVSTGPMAFMQTSLVEQLVHGDPMEDIAEFNEVRLRSRLDPGESEPVPPQFPLIYQETVEYLDRWSLFRLYPELIKLRQLYEGPGTGKKVEGKAVSLNTYYQTLPEYLRNDPNVKNVYRGLEFRCANLSLEQKEKALNLAAKYSMPLDELADDAFTIASDNVKPQPTAWDEDKLLNDNEGEVIDPALTPDEVDKYVEAREKIVPGGEDDWPLPKYVKDKSEQIDDLPVDYWINDDGFWNDYIKAKEQKHLDNQRISGGKMFLQH